MITDSRAVCGGGEGEHSPEPGDLLYRSEWETERAIPHEEAREIAGRLIASHFNNPGEHARVGIPARPDYDDDLLIHAYIKQQARKDAALASTAGAGAGTTAQHLRDALAPHASQDGTWFSFGLSDLDALSKRLPAGAGAGDWVAVPDDVRAAVQKLDAVREEEHQRLAAGEGMRLYRMVPLEHHANGLCLDYVRSLLCAVPASPRSGAGEGEVRQAAEALLSDYRGLEAILAGMEADIPDAARVVVRVPGNAAQDIGTYGQFRALDHALKGLPASPPAPAEHGEDGRFWLELREPRRAPERKGPWPARDTARILREVMAAQPEAYITVVSIASDGTPMFSDGPETLQMADARSMATGRRHIASTAAAHDAEIKKATAQVIEAARRMPRKTPAAGGAGTVHSFQIEAGEVWGLDRALTRLDRALSQGGGAGRSERAVEIRNWQPIETAPSDGRTIIAFGGRFDEPTPTQADGAWWNSAAGRTLRGGPTHWMPLPPAPAQSPSTSDAEEQS